MRTRVCCLVAGAAAMVAPALLAQDAPTPLVFATYYRCSQGDASRADALYKEHVLPAMQAEVAAGRITAFGWEKHWSGGEWRRLEYAIGTDMDKMIDSRDAIIKMMESPEHSKAMDEFDRICSSHDDYVWGGQTGSPSVEAVGKARSPFAMSTYYVCNAREKEADAIVKTAFASVLNQRVKDGAIASWSWLEHMTGGKYRRALVMDGANPKALLHNWATLDEALEKAAPEMSKRFTEICDSHWDYVWEDGSK
jgi:hypothetical protein